MLNVKNAEIADLEQIMKIYRYAQDYMIKSGNPTQWGHFYPDADLIKSDIDKKLYTSKYKSINSSFSSLVLAKYSSTNFINELSISQSSSGASLSTKSFSSNVVKSSSLSSK